MIEHNKYGISVYNIHSYVRSKLLVLLFLSHSSLFALSGLYCESVRCNMTILSFSECVRFICVLHLIIIGLSEARVNLWIYGKISPANESDAQKMSNITVITHFCKLTPTLSDAL